MHMSTYENSTKRKRMSVSRKGILEFLVKNYYIFVIALYFQTFKSDSFRVGYYCGLIMIAIAILVILNHGFSFKVRKLEALTLGYLLYCAVTALNYLFSDVPVSSFTETVVNSLLPVIFFWCGLQGFSFSKKAYLIAYDVLCFVGIYLTFTLPDWYFVFCRSHGFSWTRLSSCVGSTVIGSMSCIAILYSYHLKMNSRSKLAIIQFVISCGFALLSFQRSAWIMTIVSVIVLNHNLLKLKIIKSYTIIFEVLFVVIIGFVFRDWIFDRIDIWILQRNVASQAQSNGTGMFSGRVGQWITNISTSNWITGSGLGTRGHRAISSGVADGDYVRMLCEIGLIGLGIFISIIYSAIKIGRSIGKDAIIPLLVVVVLALQAVGSNIFEFQITSPLFWMAIGELAKINIDRHWEVRKV